MDKSLHDEIKNAYRMQKLAEDDGCAQAVSFWRGGLECLCAAAGVEIPRNEHEAQNPRINVDQAEARSIVGQEVLFTDGDWKAIVEVLQDRSDESQEGYKLQVISTMSGRGHTNGTVFEVTRRKDWPDQFWLIWGEIPESARVEAGADIHPL